MQITLQDELTGQCIYSAARFVVHDHRRTTSFTHMQGKLGWQTLETRRLQHQLVFLYKIKYNLLNISRPQHLVVPCTRTRNSDPNKYVQIPTRINTYYAYSFYPRVIRAWNLLPVDWREIVWRIRSDIIGKREDFRRVDEYCFSIIYYINLLCTFVEKSF